MKTTIVLTMREQKRVEVIQRVFRGELTMAEAAMVLGVSERHSYRIKAKIRKEGVRCIVGLAGGKYRGFNDHHLTEKLVEVEGIKACREKIRQILRAKGISIASHAAKWSGFAKVPVSRPV